MKMSSISSRSGISEDNGGFADPELTPKPLRIAKRRDLRSSDPITINRLPSLPESHPQEDFTPIRRSPVLSIRTQLDLAQRDPTAPTSQWARRNTFLHVNKQRRSDPGHTSMAAHNNVPDSLVDSGSSSFRGSQDARRPIFVDAELGGHAGARAANTEARPASTRAVTTGAFKKTDFLRPINDEPLVPLVPTPLRRSRRRAVTANEGYHGHIESMTGTSDHGLLKQSSTRHRLISRVMSGLINRAHPNHAASKDENLTMQPPHNDTTDCNTRDMDKIDATRRSVSSAGTDDYGGSELEGALSAFPTPPSTASASPTSPTSIGFATSSRPISQQYRSLRKPEDAAAMGVQLTLTPEYDQLSSDNGKTMFVAIDVEGALNTTISGQNLWSQHTGLDMVVIIDNSLCTSPNTLMASCESARFLASNLNVVTDRLAILCTSDSGDHGSNPTTVWPLAPIKIQKLKAALDKVTCSSEKLTQDKWANSIDHAKGLLLQSAVPDQESEVLQDTYGHVLILTVDSGGVSSELLAHDKLHFHIICPAIVPREDGQVIASEGWRLRLLSAIEPRVVSASKDTDPMSLFNKIRGLTTHARGGNLPGRLHDVTLDIVPGLDCSIEDVMGSREWPTLHPGELHTILAKLRVRTSKARGYSFTQAAHQSEVSLDNHDILGELDEMLGVSAVRVLTATLRYKHSLLPKDTTCSVTVDCQLKRQLASPDQNKSSVQVYPSPPSACKVLVHKRLAYHLAVQGSPRHALSKVRKVFGETGSRAFCPDYVNLIIKELKFQARITERLEIDASPKKPISNTTPNQPDSPFEHFGQGLFQAANYKPDDWITDAIDEGVSNKEEVQLAVLANGKQNKPNDKRQKKWLYAEPNEAKVIWGDIQKASKLQQHGSMRKASKPKHLAGLEQGSRKMSSSVEQDRQRRVRELDGWVKESVRTNKLRNFTSLGDSK